MRSCRNVLFAMFFAMALTPQLFAEGTAKYFLLIVWDGMRPDFASEELTPNLHALRERGVWFANHHSAYPTSTEVNGTVLATGVYPRRSGVTANKEYRSELEPLKYYATESLTAVRRGDELSGGKYLRVPTIAEMVQSKGGQTAVVGAKPVALLHDRLPRSNDSANPVWFVNGALPSALGAELTNRFGGFPAASSPNTARDLWATRCLTEQFWAKGMPRYSVLWLSEPDYSQHHHGPGSREALAGIRSSDQRLAAVLAELDRRGVREQTDIFVVSDHGFSTITANGNIAATLQAAGINARPTWDVPPAQDDVVTVGNGGSVLIYVIGHSPKTVERVVQTLQQDPRGGVLFTRDGIAGTFSLAEARLDSPTAPDVVISSGWKKSRDATGRARSEVTNEGYSEYNIGCGMHVTLSPTDLHNLAVAAGPDFRRKTKSQLPSGNVDVVPTLLWLMGIEPSQPLDGRVLSEALSGKAPSVGKASSRRLDARREFATGVWEQHLDFTEVNGVRYLDEGNGGWIPTRPQSQESTSGKSASGLLRSDRN